MDDFYNGITIAGFILGLMNYQENLTQNDKQELMDNSSKIQDTIINKIDQHLQTQDKKIDAILRYLQYLAPAHQNFT